MVKSTRQVEDLDRERAFDQKKLFESHQTQVEENQEKVSIITQRVFFFWLVEPRSVPSKTHV